MKINKYIIGLGLTFSFLLPVAILFWIRQKTVN